MKSIKKVFKATGSAIKAGVKKLGSAIAKVAKKVFNFFKAIAVKTAKKIAKAAKKFYKFWTHEGKSKEEKKFFKAMLHITMFIFSPALCVMTMVFVVAVLMYAPGWLIFLIFLFAAYMINKVVTNKQKRSRNKR
ncbi:MAG: hypothetical protein K6F69_07425 [Treponema sp.]|nr:hypothetical protein [Treponema sp.]